MLARCLQRRHSIKTTLCQCLVLAVYRPTVMPTWLSDRQTELFIYVSLPSHIQLYNITNNEKGTSHLDLQETRT